jgi:hypothetical protein
MALARPSATLCAVSVRKAALFHRLGQTFHKGLVIIDKQKRRGPVPDRREVFGHASFLISVSHAMA